MFKDEHELLFERSCSAPHEHTSCEQVLKYVNTRFHCERQEGPIRPLIRQRFRSGRYTDSGWRCTRIKACPCWKCFCSWFLSWSVIWQLPAAVGNTRLSVFMIHAGQSGSCSSSDCLVQETRAGSSLSQHCLNSREHLFAINHLQLCASVERLSWDVSSWRKNVRKSSGNHKHSAELQIHPGKTCLKYFSTALKHNFKALVHL